MRLFLVFTLSPLSASILCIFHYFFFFSFQGEHDDKKKKSDKKRKTPDQGLNEDDITDKSVLNPSGLLIEPIEANLEKKRTRE